MPVQHYNLDNFEQPADQYRTDHLGDDNGYKGQGDGLVKELVDLPMNDLPAGPETLGDLSEREWESTRGSRKDSQPGGAPMSAGNIDNTGTPTGVRHSGKY